MDDIRNKISWVATLPEIEGPTLTAMKNVLGLLNVSDELIQLARVKRTEALRALEALEAHIESCKKWTTEQIEQAKKLSHTGGTEG